MTISLQKGPGQEAGDSRFTMNSDMTIYSAAQNHQELIAHLEGFDSIDIDLSAVHEIDCSGIQLLLAMKRDIDQASKRLTLRNPSAAVDEVMSLLNVRDRFDWVDASRD